MIAVSALCLTPGDAEKLRAAMVATGVVTDGPIVVDDLGPETTVTQELASSAASEAAMVAGAPAVMPTPAPTITPAPTVKVTT